MTNLRLPPGHFACSKSFICFPVDKHTNVAANWNSDAMTPTTSFQKNYRAHLKGVVFSRAYLLVVLFIFGLRWLAGTPPVDLLGAVLAILCPLPVVMLMVFMEYDPLPAKYWFEAETLVVEDPSGEIRRYQRWVKLGRLGLKTVYAQTPGRTLRLPLWAYQPASSPK